MWNPAVLHQKRLLTVPAENTAIVSSHVRFLIGGLAFELSGGDLPLLQVIDRRYRPFLLREGAPGAHEPFLLRLEVDPSPSRTGRVILHSGATWSILARGHERIFVFEDGSGAEPLYAARFRPGSREISVRCSPRLVEAVGRVRVLRSPFHYPFDQVLAMYLLGESGLVLHAAGLTFEGTGVAFPGVSGAGKSTICGLASGRPGWSPLSDDRVIVRLRAGRVALHGTPWPGESGAATNAVSPLGGLVFLEQGEAGAIRFLERREALGRLLQTASLPWFDEEYLERGLSACGELSGAVSPALLTFRREGGALEAVERLLQTTPGTSLSTAFPERSRGSG